MSTHGMFRSVVWKDYRELRTFWLATLLLAVGLEFLGILMVTRFDMAEYTIFPTLAYALITPGLYALGCAAMMFAGEHESGMYHLTQTLPVDPRRLLLGRTFFVLASTLLMLVATCAAFLYLQRAMELEVEHVSATIGIFAIVPLEFFAWGVLMSLVCRRPLAALILGSILSICDCAIIVTWTANTWSVRLLDNTPSSSDWWPAALAIRLVVVGLLMAINMRLATLWFRDGGMLRLGKLFPTIASIKTQTSADSGRHSVTTKATTELGRLLWQQWRQSRRLINVFALATLILGVLCALVPRSHNDPEDPGAFLLLLLVPLAGVCVFREDWRSNRFRFLAQCGAKPGRIWWTRQLVWLGVSIAILLVAIFLFGIACFEELGNTSHSRYHEIQRTPLGGLVSCFAFVLSLLMGTELEKVPIPLIFILSLPGLAMLIGYACGQFCSIYTRSTIVASMATFGLLLIVAGWISAMTALWIDWLWSVVPIPFVLLLATRLRMRDWLLERTDWRAKTKTVLVPVVPMLMLLVGVPFYRVYSVPKVELNLPVYVAPPRPTADEIATAKLYKKAYEIYVPMEQKDDKRHFSDYQSDLAAYLFPEKMIVFNTLQLPEIYIERLKANQKTIDAVLLASRRPKCSLHGIDGVSWIIEPRHVGDLIELLLTNARHLTTQGKLNDALEQYLAAARVTELLDQAYHRYYASSLRDYIEWGLLCWAAHPNQTAERIERALDESAKLYAPPPPLSHEVILNWRNNRLQIDHADSIQIPSAEQSKDSGKAFIKYVQAMALKWFPWEQERARRVVDGFAYHELEKVEEVESALAKSGLAEYYSYSDPLIGQAIIDSTFLGNNYLRKMNGELRSLEENTARNRAFRLQMALAAWRREHGKVPKSLDELVGKYFDVMPVDPYTGKPFRYFPKGIPQSVIEADKKILREDTFGPGGPHDQYQDYFPDGLGPFLWSPGEYGSYSYEVEVAWKSFHKQGEEAAKARWLILNSYHVYPVP